MTGPGAHGNVRRLALGLTLGPQGNRFSYAAASPQRRTFFAFLALALPPFLIRMGQSVTFGSMVNGARG